MLQQPKLRTTTIRNSQKPPRPSIKSTPSTSQNRHFLSHLRVIIKNGCFYESEDKELFRGNVLDFRYQLIDVSSEEYNNLNFSLEIRSILYTLKNIWHLHEREYIRAFSHEFLSKLRRTDAGLYKKIVDYWWGFVKVKPEEILKHVFQKEENIMKSTMTQLLERGIKKGKAEGIEEGKLEDTRTMLRKSYSLTDITEITGLTEEQLEGAGINGKTAM